MHVWPRLTLTSDYLNEISFSASSHLLSTLKLSGFIVSSAGAVTPVCSMAATIHLPFESKHRGMHTRRLLAQQLPPQLEVRARVFVHVRIREICVVISKSPFKDSMCVPVVRFEAWPLSKTCFLLHFRVEAQSKGGSWSSSGRARSSCGTNSLVLVCVCV